MRERDLATDVLQGALVGLRRCSVIALFLGAAASLAAGTGGRLAGTVADETGAAVAGAEVTALSGGARLATRTGRTGRFIFADLPAARAMLTVQIPGFERSTRSWEAERDGRELHWTLAAARRGEYVLVTAWRARSSIADAAASVTALDARDLDLTPASTLDDALRQVPGFALFRRQGSRAANPTAQGVSLRGVGASGASRALVLVDGLPLGDPFGGWVYWDRVPRASLRRVEVMRGGASHLYGSDALGGVVQLWTKTSAAPELTVGADYGSHGSGLATLFAGGRLGPLGASLAAETAATDGYVLVGEAERGPVDTPADSRHRGAQVTLDVWPRAETRVFLRGSLFAERRRNGTPLQNNRTYHRQAALGLDAPLGGGTLSAQTFVTAQIYDQTFSTVAAERAAESLTRLQRVPAQQAGLGAQWSRAFGTRLALLAGIDGRHVEGTTDELGYGGGVATSGTSAGGAIDTSGAFLQASLGLSARTSVSLALRADAWRHREGRVVTRALATDAPSGETAFPDRHERALSPRLSLVHRPGAGVSLFASAYRAFRAPTLNELYRSFRVGNVVTQANERLAAEHLTGAEAGTGWEAADGRLDLRAAAFWSRISDPISNVTLEATPALITRRRQNLGSTQSHGLEIEVGARPSRRLSLGAGYQWVRARVRRFPADPSLEGRRLPQVAEHQATFRAGLALPWHVFVSLQGRAAGPQFDDDRNLVELRGYLTLDGLVSAAIAPRIELYAAVENVLGSRYEVGRTPVTTYGPPRQARIGLRLRTPIADEAGR